MGDEVVGIVHPCKIYGAMAVGRPILFFGPQRSHGGEIVSGHLIGWTVPHGDVDGAVHAIVAAAKMDPAALARLGASAAEAVATEFSPARLRGRVCDVIEL
jgi:glycosyltransferase involved in cell wall biosynthesis